MKPGRGAPRERRVLTDVPPGRRSAAGIRVVRYEPRKAPGACRGASERCMT